MIVDEAQNPDLHRFIHDSNLLRQYDLLEDCVTIALETNSHYPDHQLLRNLNQTAVVHLSEHAGVYRPHDVRINKSEHQPPPWREVPSLTNDFLNDLARRWNSEEPIWLSAYCLWMINWIHPFAEGNGRTARAVSYFTLCVKFGMWLPGAEIIPMQIRNDREPYYRALRAADEVYKRGEVNLKQMRSYLEALLKVQVSGSDTA